MAERRMFAKTIIDSDAFLDMPQSTQLLYFHLAMRADDDGFINNPKSIMRNVKCNEDDLKLLITKKFIIPFESGIVVIKHWKIHNYIRKDTYTETKYKEEKALLELDENKSYRQLPQGCDEYVTGSSTQVRIGKVSIGKDKDIYAPSDADKSVNKRFVKPTLEEVEGYCKERNNYVDPQAFIDYYESNGWKVGRNGMRDWKATIRNWERKAEKPKVEEQADEWPFF